MRDRKVEFNNTDLTSDKLLADILVGGLLSNSMFASLNKVAGQLHFTERRISQAADRLYKAGRLIKKANLIIPEVNVHGDLKKINQFRYDLLTYHGIRTPGSIIYKRVRYFMLYWINSYFLCIDTTGLKDNSYLTPKVSKNYPLKLVSGSFKNYSLWEFNTKIYNFQDYLNDFGFKNI